MFPCALIACMVFFTFVLPPECGERVSLCITILMAMTIFQELTSEKLPPSSDTFFLIGESIQNTLVMSWATNYSLIFGTFSVLTFETCQATVEIPELPWKCLDWNFWIVIVIAIVICHSPRGFSRQVGWSDVTLYQCWISYSEGSRNISTSAKIFYGTTEIFTGINKKGKTLNNSKTLGYKPYFVTRDIKR